jgi:CheY-specific phosphatase CheX
MMMVEPVAGEFDTSAEGVVIARVGFSGVIDGSVLISVVPEFSEVLAANVMGIERDDASIREYAEDSLRELGNILTGNFLTEAYGTDTVFTLGIPEIVKAAEVEISSNSDDRINFTFEADNCPIRISFIVEG